MRKRKSNKNTSEKVYIEELSENDIFEEMKKYNDGKKSEKKFEKNPKSSVKNKENKENYKSKSKNKSRSKGKKEFTNKDTKDKEKYLENKKNRSSKTMEIRSLIEGYVQASNYSLCRVRELAKNLKISEKDYRLFNDAVSNMNKEGDVLIITKGKIYPVNGRSMKSGKFSKYGDNDFGFAMHDEKDLDDLFIHASDAMGAMNGDKIVFKEIPSRRGRSRGEVIKIIERAVTRVVGDFNSTKKDGFVVCNDKVFRGKVYIINTDFIKVKDGDKVAVKLVKYGFYSDEYEGEIIKVIGDKDTPKIDILSILNSYPVETEFSEKLIEMMSTLDNEINPKDIKGRKDFRNIPIITIDGEDAKDLDDAVYLEKLENGNFELSVHIADVTNYVKENSLLDRVAYKRATSIYLVDRVIPMLPEKLSNGLCSLHPRVDRLTMSCVMEINEKGHVIKHKLYKSVINSKYRMTYNEVKEILENQPADLMDKYKEIIPMLKQMNDLRSILGEKRRRRGTIDFNFPEAKIILNENGKAVDIKAYNSNIATNLIEEFMLVCNETVAKRASISEIPFVYRNHPEPSDTKLERLSDILASLGYLLRKKDGKINVMELQRIIKEVKGKSEETIITRMILRSMMQAVYQGTNIGHFGLASENYSHFTSPIRRYPDLLIHRFLKMDMDKEFVKELNKEKIAYYNDKIHEWAKHCSEAERVAEELERETIQIKKVEYMSDKIGEIYTGIISGIATKRIFVELENTIEGSIALDKMEEDTFRTDDQNIKIIGSRTGKIYNIGDVVTIKVEVVDKENALIDFSIVSNNE